jgi:hypothetical protein
MRKVSQSSPTQILGDDKFNFRSRAGPLVEKWTPSLVEHAKTCRWIAEGETDLVYASSPEYRNNDDCTSVEIKVENLITDGILKNLQMTC